MGKLPQSMRFAEERVMECLAARRAVAEAPAACSSSSTAAQASSEDRNNAGSKASGATSFGEETTGAQEVDTIGDAEHGEEHVDYQKRTRKREYVDEEEEAGAEHQKSLGIAVVMPVFGPRSFLTFEEFEVAWAYYCANHFASYRADHTLRREAANAKRQEEFEKAMKKAAERGVDFSKSVMLIPPTLSHAIVTYKCVHGVRRKKKRGSGKRKQKKSFFFDCPAQIVGRATYHADEDRWDVVLDSENCTHNHECTLESYIAYMTSSHIKDHSLRKELLTMVSVHGKTRVILDKVNRVLPFSRRQLENFKAYRNGGVSALAGLHGLLLRYTDFEEYLVLIIEDQDGVTVGIGLQTKMQRKLFIAYGDNIILDWTHNTNNVGYYVGSFMVTTASGKGVSVFDMLCLTQSKDMMRAFFEHFIKTNPGARERVKSFVIDKDYTEWEVLEEMFGYSVVVLCQFHVLKWFTYVVTLEKYAIPVPLRDDVLRSLRIMVYASSADDFTHQQLVLKNLLAAKHHQPFLQYLRDRWYSCSRMWANFVRGSVFTACNTTSNRLESFWRRYKEDLGFRQRVDKCVETIFLHATSVLTREKNEFVSHATSASLSAAAVPFLEPLLRDLGEFTTKLVQFQWIFYAGAPPGAYQVVKAYGQDGVESADPTTYVVRVTAQRPADFTVCLRSWTCTCHFFCGSALPCRHLMYVADSVRRMVHYPVATLSPRWSMSEAARFIGDLVRAIDELSVLRTDLLPELSTDPKSHHTSSSKDQVEETQRFRDFKLRVASSNSAFTTVKIQRAQTGDAIELEPNEKENYFSAQLANIKRFMKAQGPARFQQCSIELDDALAALEKKWSRDSGGDGASRDDKQKSSIEDAPVGPRPLQETSEDLVPAARAEQGNMSTCGDSVTSFEPVFQESAPEEAGVFRPSSNATDEFYMCEEDIPVSLVSQLTAAQNWRSEVPHSPTSLSPGLHKVVRQPGFDVLGMDSMLAQPGNREMLRDAIAFPYRPSLLDELMSEVDDCGSDVSLVLAAPEQQGNTTTSGLVRGDTMGNVLPNHPTANVGTLTVGPEELSTMKRPRSAENSENCTVSPGAFSAAKRPNVKDESVARRKQIFKMKVPMQTKSRGVTSTHKKSVTGRIPTPEYRGDCPVEVADFLVALAHCMLSRASLLLPQYPVMYDDISLQNRLPTANDQIVVKERLNFRVPFLILAKLKAILPSMPPSSPSRPLDPDTSTTTTTHPKKEFVARFTVDSRGFTRADINILGEFESLEAKLMAYKKDLEWLEGDTFWPVPQQQPAVDFLIDETEGLGDVDPEDPFHTTKMRAAVVAALAPASLQTLLALSLRDVPLGLTQDLANNTRVMVGDLIGRVARTEWLNDSVVNYSINMLAAPFADIVVVDSLNQGNIVVPRQNAHSVRLVVFPIHFSDDKHWCSICVVLNWHTGSHIAFAYDPDRFGTYEPKVSGVWRDWCVPLLKAWSPTDELFAIGMAPLNFVTSPKQPDSNSCGVHVILHIYNWMWNKLPEPKSSDLTPFAIQVLRLRILWLAVCNSVHSSDSVRAKEANMCAEEFDTYASSSVVTKRMTRSLKIAERNARGRGRGLGRGLGRGGSQGK